MIKNLSWLFFIAVSVSHYACFAPHKYFKEIPVDGGESKTFSLSDSVLLQLSSQILLVHDFKLAEPIRGKDDAIILVGEKVGTELFTGPPLSEGAVRVWIQPLGKQESRIVFTWHSFYRKNLERRIREDKKVNTERFWEILTLRIDGLAKDAG